MDETAQVALYLSNAQEWTGELEELVYDIAGGHDTGDRPVLTSNQNVTMLRNVSYCGEQRSINADYRGKRGHTVTD